MPHFGIGGVTDAPGAGRSRFFIPLEFRNDFLNALLRRLGAPPLPEPPIPRATPQPTIPDTPVIPPDVVPPSTGPLVVEIPPDRSPPTSTPTTVATPLGRASRSTLGLLPGLSRAPGSPSDSVAGKIPLSCLRLRHPVAIAACVLLSQLPKRRTAPRVPRRRRRIPEPAPRRRRPPTPRRRRRTVPPIIPGAPAPFPLPTPPRALPPRPGPVSPPTVPRLPPQIVPTPRSLPTPSTPIPPAARPPVGPEATPQPRIGQFPPPSATPSSPPSSVPFIPSIFPFGTPSQPIPRLQPSVRPGTAPTVRLVPDSVTPPVPGTPTIPGSRLQPGSRLNVPPSAQPNAEQCRACATQSRRRRREKSKCLQRFNVAWTSGPDKGRIAGSRCYVSGDIGTNVRRIGRRAGRAAGRRIASTVSEFF